MKLSVKISLSMILLITAVLSLGGVLFLNQDFYESMGQAKTAAAAEHLRQQVLIQMALEENVPDNRAKVNEVLYRHGSDLARYSEQYPMAIYHDNSLVFDSLAKDIKAERRSALLGHSRDKQTDVQMVLPLSGEYWVLSCSGIAYQEFDIQLITAENITHVYDRREATTEWFVRIEAAVILVAAVLSVLISRLLTKPLSRLERTANAIAGGDFSARTRVRGGDEIAGLSRSFDYMADKVEQQIEQLNLSITQRDDFIAAFSHEVKTPMTGIIGYADILRESDADTHTLQIAADAIYHDAKRLELLSQKLLQLYGLNNSEKILFSEVKLSAVMRDAAAALGAPQQVHRQKETELTVWGSGELLVDLVKNLVQNSLNSLNAGGSVWVLWHQTGEKVCVEVVDNGCGIPPKELSRITEPFYMVDKSRARRQKGSGVGLALCSRIARLHGTELFFESTVGKGTRCKFFLAGYKVETTGG